MGIWEKLFGAKAQQTEKPVQNMSDPEVEAELMDLAKKSGTTEFYTGMLARGAGARELLNLERRAQRMKST